MIYRFFHAFFNLLFRTLFGYSISGKNHLPPRGPFIICANHTSWFDPPLAGCIIPAKNKVHFMAKEELFHIRVLGWIIKKMGAFPVRRSTADRKAIRQALRILEEGGVVGLFPEGTRIKTGELGKPLQGAALIPMKSQKPVVPVAIKWPPGPFKRIRVAIGAPVVFQGSGKGSLEEISAQIMEEIRKQWVSLTP